MNIKKFNDICLNITDGTHSTVVDNPLGSYYLLSCKNVKDGHINITSSDRKIDSNTINQLRKRTKMNKGDVVLTTVGTIGESSVIEYENPNYEFQRSVAIIKPNNNIVESKYLHYYLISPLGQSIVKSRIKGAAQPCLFLNDIKDIEINLPSLIEQQHIVNTIGSVDDLIESNANFISKFQQYLSQIYKLYCLDINYEVELNSLIVRTGKTLKNKEWFGSNVLDLSTMPNNNIFINDFSCGENFTTNIKTLNNLDLVYGSIRPYFKKAGFALDVDYIAGSVYSFMPLDEKNYLWLLACICSDDFHLFTSSNSQGTKMPIINWDTFSSFKIRYDSKIIHEFNKQVQPLFDLCVIKAREIRRLKAIKEKLLSKYF